MIAKSRPDPFSISSKIRTLTVVIPVWNEAAYIQDVIKDFLELNAFGFHIELLIVESKSTDGTREILKEIEFHWRSDSIRLKVLYQENPKGKGFAVREGLKHASGDVIAIFDADREYTPSDCLKLLTPIEQGVTSFVLGSRTSQTFTVRNFKGAPIKSLLFNVAQFALTKAFNIVYQNSLRDPFTMWKVFRVECIQGLSFVANRFDFDWELLAKCLRSGVKPVEIPITYKSRGFSEGKKVRIFKDGSLALFALIRFRIGKI